jgi:hypothetical protein
VRRCTSAQLGLVRLHCAREAGLDCGHSRDPVVFSRVGAFSEHLKCSGIYLIRQVSGFARDGNQQLRRAATTAEAMNALSELRK